MSVDEQESVITVGELGRRLRQAAEACTLDEPWVEGEVTGLKRAASGHVYFTLKDEREDAVVDCVAYRFQAQRCRAVLEEGAQIQCRGKATVWAPRGRLQFIVESARRTGQGSQLEALERLKRKLWEEGLFAPERKRQLPFFPRTIGVVTSGQGAAFQDICKVAARRGAVRIVLSPALVQGEGAPDSLLRAIDLLERLPDLDLMIVGRGGGSGEDLMAFNDERLVRRLAKVRVPVISAVGHEIDTSLADLVADVRAATPSQAAELAVPDAMLLRQQVQARQAALARALKVRLLASEARVGRLGARLRDPRFLLAERQQLLDDWRFRSEKALRNRFSVEQQRVVSLSRALDSQHPRRVLERYRGRHAVFDAQLAALIRQRLAAAESELAQRGESLRALSPLAILERGYALVSLPDGRLLRDSREAPCGTRLSLRLAHGTVRAETVSSTDE